VGGPNTIPMPSVKYSGVSSNSATVDATKFAGPHKSHMRQYITQCLLQQGTTDAVLNRHRRGLPPWSSESDIRPLSSYPSSIPHFPLVAPPSLTFTPTPSHCHRAPASSRPTCQPPGPRHSRRRLPCLQRARMMCVARLLSERPEATVPMPCWFTRCRTPTPPSTL
jgi:hypothetical protein